MGCGDRVEKACTLTQNALNISDLASFTVASAVSLDRFADLVLPRVSPARGPPTRGELLQVHDDVEIVQIAPALLPAIDIHSL